MDAKDIKALHVEVKRRMDQAVEHLRHELAGVRSGRASLGILDGLTVEYYGTPTPLSQVATLSVPESNLIVAQPWEPSLIGPIEKVIRSSDLGLNPANDGKVVRIPVPPLTEERRKQLSKHVHKLSEDARNSIRQARRDANDRLKRMLKDRQISEDDERRAIDEIQKATDGYVKQVDDVQKKKDQELLAH